MTEEQAIERLMNAMLCGDEWMSRGAARRYAVKAWNEMKAIAQEDTTTLRFYTGKAVNGSDGKELIL